MFEGDGNFSTSPNLAGAVGGIPTGMQRGAFAVVVTTASGVETSTASWDRSEPAPFVDLSRADGSVAGFSVSLMDG